MNLAKLHGAIAAVCPVVGVSVGNPSDKSTWRIDYDASATTAQKTSANEVLVSYVEPAFDPLDTWDVVTLKLAFNHENRIRALEGKAAITVAQFKTAVRAML